MKNLMVIAHPDDEILFGYTALSQGDWHVVCMTNGIHPVRYPEFKKSMEFFGASYDIWNYPDRWGEGFDEVGAAIDIGNTLLRLKPEKVLTHNQWGEYGHSQHMSLNRVVSGLVEKNLYTFGMDSYMSLPFNTLKNKMEALCIYKSQIVLNAFDWYDQNNSNVRLMNYVISERHIRVK